MVFLILSLVFVAALCCVAPFRLKLRHARANNARHRIQVLEKLGIGLSDVHSKKIVGFFHPYCNAGGGGERVLWTAIAILQRTEPDVISVVYSGDVDATKEEIIDKVKARFDITLNPPTLHFVFLNSRHLVEDAAWPRFTLLGQSLGSMYLAWEAMTKLMPDLYIDTMGYAFTFPVISWVAQIPVGAYVHYPTISTDMLARVQARKKWHTNSDFVSSSAILSKGKLLYYRLFMYYYSLSLQRASFLMVNSSWTKNHIDSILNHTDVLVDALHLLPPLVLVRYFLAYGNEGHSKPKEARIVYPPCDTREMVGFPLGGRERVVLSVAQFRPEKDHPAQLHAMAELLKAHPEYRASGPSTAKLVLIGGVRNAEDEGRLEGLRALARELEIEDQVEFVVNAPYAVVLDWLSRASIGLSTMVDEHFGINVVEYMSAGAIPVTHASGGPLNDIVVPFNGEPTGYHATDPPSFASAFHTVFTLPPEAERAMRERARTWTVQRFSEEEFEKGWEGCGWRGLV